MNRFIIAEPSKCIGCNTCMAACTLAHKEQGLVDHPRLKVVRDDNDTAPVVCRHCEDSPCATVCPVNAITHEDHSVHINESTCIGCKMCGLACPFGAITPAACKPEGLPNLYEHNVSPQLLCDVPGSLPNVNPFLAWNVGVKTVAVKCDLCYFREQGPACIESCPTNALYLVDDAQLERIAAKKRVESMKTFVEMKAHSNASVNSNEGGHHG